MKNFVLRIEVESPQPRGTSGEDLKRIARPLAQLGGTPHPVKMLNINNNTDGISFLSELFGNNNWQKKHEYLYFEFPEKGGEVAIRLGD
ncbi:MAG: hypothetical protein WKF97_05740 [Chitinophagaceae bacterium]